MLFRIHFKNVYVLQTTNYFKSKLHNINTCTSIISLSTHPLVFMYLPVYTKNCTQKTTYLNFININYLIFRYKRSLCYP